MKEENQKNQEPAEAGAGSYFIVMGENGSWAVSTVMARHIEACLAAKRSPEWIAFVELTGSRVKVRARQIQWIGQSTPEQRAAERRFNRAVGREYSADQTWGEED